MFHATTGTVRPTPEKDFTINLASVYSDIFTATHSLDFINDAYCMRCLI